MNSRESLSATCKVGLSNSYVEGLCLFKSKIINRDIYINIHEQLQVLVVPILN